MAAPIDTKYLFRKKENKEICDAFMKEDVVILSGSAGVGKTRLALNYLKNYVNDENGKVYCICSNALPIYEDLKLFLNTPGNYFLFIDDANQLSGLKHIIRYTCMKEEGYNVKILITVRDYALQKVKNDVLNITSYEVVNVSVFTDDEIKEILKASFGISNKYYQDRIIRIAEGNARIAVLAGKLACSSNRLDSIDDVSQLYEDYYRSTLEDNELLANKDLCITAGIIAFLEAIHLEHIDTLLPILSEEKLDRDSFTENVRMLHDCEVVDICNDKAVYFSDQCLSNYLLKYVFFDKKLLSLSQMIKTCFPNYRERTVFSLNTLTNIFRNKELINFVQKEIQLLWDEFSRENSPIFFEFVKAFFPINPTETLLILQNKIESEQKTVCDMNEIDIKKGQNLQYVKNDFINILGGFANLDDLPAACDLFFQYYLKRPDLFMEFYNAIDTYFGICWNSLHNDYYTQITFFKKIIEYSNNWEQELIAILFLKIAEKFLKLKFSPAEQGRNDTFVIYQIPLIMSEGVKKYRKLIWESLYSLSKIEKYREKVKEILSSYGGIIEDVSMPILEYDLKYIELILKSNFAPDKLTNCILASRLARVFNRINAFCESTFSQYLEEDDFKLYRLLERSDYVKDSYEKNKEEKQQSISRYVIGCDLEKFKKLIDVCSDAYDLDSHSSWEISEGLRIAFDTIVDNNGYFVDAIKYYLKKDTPKNLLPYKLVNSLFSLLSDSEVYEIIVGGEYSQKNAWIYAYYHELPAELIKEKHLKGLYDFLKDNSDKDITSSTIRDLDFLDKYKVIDDQVFIKSCEIILAKNEYSPFTPYIYFRHLFNYHNNSPQEVIRKFGSNLNLLEEIYCFMLSYDKYHDYDGQFLREIYRVKPTILDKYIEYLINNCNKFCSDNKQRDCVFFDLDNFLEIYNKVFEQLIINCTYCEITVPHFLETLLLENENKPDLIAKQDEWICQCIQLFSKDKTKMYCLFSVISKFEIERSKKYVDIFLHNNTLFDDFEKIPLMPTSLSWTGSIVPMYFGWIEFLESLLPSLIGLKWIKHKNYIERQIRWLRDKIESEQINEILKG